MRRFIILVVVIVAILVGAAAAMLLTGRFSPEQQRQRTLRRLNENGTVVRRSCGLGEAHVDGARWRELSARDQERAASALASWCAEQGGATTLTVIDSNSHVPVGRWNGTALERVQ